jgi:valyl-tRNA synthetase
MKRTTTKRKKELPKAYEPQKVEDKIYKIWEKSGYFNPDKLPKQKERKKSYSIVMPPPNATGVLHVGHTLMLTIQDAEIRFHRMSGKKALWIPGTDHASIATQNVVEKLLAKDGISKEDLGRTKFLKEVDRFVKNSKSTIKKQIKKMGSSCDWSRERYTLDAGLSEAVSTVFVNMYNDGLIYRGFRMINWCPRCVSTLADDEVDHKELDGNLYYIKYPILDDGFLVVATTRPETLLGDTALVVNPKDKRYKEYVGKISVMPITGRKIPILADSYVATDFGTGVLKVTPGHDPNDFELGKRHKLPTIDIFDDNAKVDPKHAVENGFKKYSGLDRFEVRKKIINDLKNEGLLVKIEPHKHNVGHCYRCKTIIEPKISQQWFVAVSKKILGGKSLKQRAVDAVKNKKIEIIPNRFEKVYFHWMNNLHDWCISRQIWFGHRLPVHYCKECDEIIVSEKKPTKCKKCKSKVFRQDEDTLDTWFSSGLWTFSTLGWPKKTKDLKTFHPTSLMETGYDIIFFWVARMIIMSEYALKEVPFKKVYLHGLVRDKNGIKMSKSIGNVIDPLVMSEKYGADATRLSLIIGNSPGSDLKLSEEKIASFRNFSNKIYNIARYTILNSNEAQLNEKTLTLADKWILKKLEKLTQDVTQHYEKVELSPAGEKLKEFIWGDLADWYLEISKTQEKDVLKYTLKNILILAHPLLPFLTEYLWEFAEFKKSAKDLLMIQKWPTLSKSSVIFKLKLENDIERQFELVKYTIIMIRTLRTEYKVEPKKKILATIFSKEYKVINSFKQSIEFLAGLSDVIIKESGEKPKNSAQMSSGNVSVYIPLLDLVDKNKEKVKLKKEIEKTSGYLKSIRAKLNNQNFIKNAPKNIVRQEKEKLKEQEQNLKDLEQKIKLL